METNMVRLSNSFGKQNTLKSYINLNDEIFKAAVAILERRSCRNRFARWESDFPTRNTRREAIFAFQRCSEK